MSQQSVRLQSHKGMIRWEGYMQTQQILRKPQILSIELDYRTN